VRGWLVIVPILAGCDIPATGPTVTSEAVAYDAAAGKYGLREVELHDLDSIYTLRGKALEFFGGAKLDINLAATQNGCTIDNVDCTADYATLRRAVVDDSIRKVHPRFELTGSVYRPLDFDTLNMTTAYAELSAAEEYYARFGWDVAAVGRAPVYYYPEAKGLFALAFPKSDNAAYFQVLDGFILLPMEFLQDLPFSMNRGVMFHEYHHRVFSVRVYGGNLFRLLAAPGDANAIALALNRIKALDEGVADFFGAVGAGDSNFLLASVRDNAFGDRDVATARVINPAWLTGEQPVQDALGTAVYDPYKVGSIFAYCFWTLLKRSSESAVVEAWFRTEPRLAAQLARDLSSFEFSSAINVFVSELDAAARPSACELFNAAFEPIKDQISGCP
jgi:hypothetical protein